MLSSTGCQNPNYAPHRRGPRRLCFEHDVVSRRWSRVSAAAKRTWISVDGFMVISYVTPSAAPIRQPTSHICATHFSQYDQGASIIGYNERRQQRYRRESLHLLLGLAAVTQTDAHTISTANARSGNTATEKVHNLCPSSRMLTRPTCRYYRLQTGKLIGAI